MPLFPEMIFGMISIFKNFWNCFWDLVCDLSWRNSPCTWEECLLLYLGGIFYVFDLKCSSNAVPPCWFSFWMMHPHLNGGHEINSRLSTSKLTTKLEIFQYLKTFWAQNCAQKVTYSRLFWISNVYPKKWSTGKVYANITKV